MAVTACQEFVRERRKSVRDNFVHGVECSDSVVEL
jgi:hypothetical protein